MAISNEIWEKMCYGTNDPQEIADRILGGLPPEAEKKTVLQLDNDVWNFGYRSQGLIHQENINPRVAKILQEKGYPVEQVEGQIKI